MKELHISIFRTALKCLIFMGLVFAISFKAYGQTPTATIRSNYVKLSVFGSGMEHVGNPTGVGNLPHISAACGGEFKYNWSDYSNKRNKFYFFTGVAQALPTVPSPDHSNRDHFRVPTMTQNTPNAAPSGTAFTVGNVTAPSVTTSGVFSNFTYHDLIHSATGYTEPTVIEGVTYPGGSDGVPDGYTGIANLNGFRIEHSAFITLNSLPNAAGINVPDEVDFLFTITNTSAQARVFGMSWNVDTQIGYGGNGDYGDMAPFFGPGLNEFRTSLLSVGFPVVSGSAAEHRYMTTLLTRVGWPPGTPIPTGYLFSEGNPYTHAIPDYIYGLHPSCNYSGLIKTGLPNAHGQTWTKADYFAVAHVNSANGNIAESFYYGVNNGQPDGGSFGISDDSGHILRWNPRIVLPGETIRIGFSFGGSDAENPPPSMISLTDQMAPSRIIADPSELFYTNSPFQSETRVYNGAPGVTLVSGKVILKIPKAQLRVEPSMLQGSNAWVLYDEDEVFASYSYAIPQLSGLQTHTVNPPVHLFVISQCVSDVNTQYFLALDDIVTQGGNPNISDPLIKNLFIPKIFCFCGGDGTASDPFQICTIEELSFFAKYVNGGHSRDDGYFILMEDLDATDFLSETGDGHNGGFLWRPIGDLAGTCFRGHFDGNNKVIRNISINRPNQDYIGLFGCAIEGSIRNLGMEGGTIVGQDYVGSLVGSNGILSPPSQIPATTSICYATGLNVRGRRYVGGLIGGNFNNSTIENCYTTNIVTGQSSSVPSSYVGGLVGGQQNNATLAYSYATGNVTGQDWVGGLAGRNAENSTIKNCVAANISVRATDNTAFVKRIAPSTANANFHNNYANNTMELQSSGVEVDVIDGSPESGDEMDNAFFQALIFYNTPGYWLASSPWSMDREPNPGVIWRVCDFTRFPFFQWQTDITCLSLSPKSIFYVDHTKVGDGSSWENAYPNLADPLILSARQRSGAIPVATNDTIREIYVAEGSYLPMHNADGYAFTSSRFPTTGGGRTNAFVLVPGMRIYGGFVPDEIPLGVSLPNFGTTGRNGITELSGDLKGNETDRAYHILIGVNIPENSHTIIDGFTISGGNANSPATSIRVNNEEISNHTGGGIYNSNASPLFINTNVTGNQAAMGAGVFNNTFSAPMFTNVRISGNWGQSNGGGMLNENASPILTNVTISGNRALSGGGLCNTDNATPVINNSIVWGNTADNVYNDNGVPVFSYSIVGGSGGSEGWNVVFGTDEGSNIDADPLFVAAISPLLAPTVSGDYSLQGGASSAVLTGSNDLYLTARGISDFIGETDISGNRRLTGPIIDRGAYEYPLLTIFATAGPGGTIRTPTQGSPPILPPGAVPVDQGEDVTFYFPPEHCYHIYRVLVNGVNNPAAVASGSFTFTNVMQNQSIEVLFRLTEYITHIEDRIEYGEIYEFCGDTLDMSGVYLCNLTTANNCDSLVILTLEVLEYPCIPVEHIINVPVEVWLGTPRKLDGMVIPENAHGSRNIRWSIIDTGTTESKLLSSGTGSNMSTMLLANRTGKVLVKATIIEGLCKNDLGVWEDFEEVFEIVVKTPENSSPKFMLYPNPTFGYFLIKNENLFIEIAAIQIYDATGRLIRSSAPLYKSSESKEFVEMDISDLIAGVYFLNIVTMNPVTGQSVVIPHKVVRK